MLGSIYTECHKQAFPAAFHDAGFLYAERYGTW